MTGDLEREPVEGVDALDDLADALVPEQDEPETPEPEDDESEESDDSEVDEPEDEDEDDEEEAEDDPTVKLKHDGKEIEVKLSEALNLAQQGYDYSKKTMAVAEERKAVEAEKAKVTEVRTRVEQERDETIRRLQAYTQFMESQVGQMPDASMLSYDTSGYILAKEQFEARRGQLQQAYSEIQRLQDEQARQRQAWIAEKAEATEKVLADTLPGWSEATLDELSGYAKGLGLTPETSGDALLAPGFWQMVHKAKAYDAIQAKKSEMKPTHKLAKVAKPAARNTTGKATERAKREAAFNKNPSVDALAELLR